MVETDDGHRAVEVTIAGYGPAPFVVDTGAGQSAITRDIAEALGIAGDEATGVDTLTEHFRTTTVPLQLALPGGAPRAVEAVIVESELDRGYFARGLLGADFFQGRRIRLDFPAGELCLDIAPFSQASGSHHWGLGILTGEASFVRGRLPLQVLVDTGAAHSLVNEAAAKGVAAADTAMRLRIMGVGTRIEQVRDTRRFFDFEMGGLCFALMRLPSADIHVFEVLGWADEPAMVLGMDALRHARIAIDYETGDFRVEGQRRYTCR